jgi:predicted PhzF superfamily epimerase YddE/YHI9
MALTRYTLRAIIACSWSGDKPGVIRFRYFAPQYGVAEDSATGSAMRILLDYCQQNYQLEYLEAFQCSPAGGVLFARAVADRIAVGGRVECLDTL